MVSPAWRSLADDARPDLGDDAALIDPAIPLRASRLECLNYQQRGLADEGVQFVLGARPHAAASVVAPGYVKPVLDDRLGPGAALVVGLRQALGQIQQAQRVQ